MIWRELCIRPGMDVDLVRRLGIECERPSTELPTHKNRIKSFTCNLSLREIVDEITLSKGQSFLNKRGIWNNKCLCGFNYITSNWAITWNMVVTWNICCLKEQLMKICSNFELPISNSGKKSKLHWSLCGVDLFVVDYLRYFLKDQISEDLYLA